MTLSEMRAILEKATPAPWVATSINFKPSISIWDEGFLRSLFVSMSDVHNNMENVGAVITMRNNFEKFLKVAEAAKEYSWRGHHDTCQYRLDFEGLYPCNCGYEKTELALEELEK